MNQQAHLYNETLCNLLPLATVRIQSRPVITIPHIHIQKPNMMPIINPSYFKPSHVTAYRLLTPSLCTASVFIKTSTERKRGQPLAIGKYDFTENLCCRFTVNLKLIVIQIE